MGIFGVGVVDRQNLRDILMTVRWPVGQVKTYLVDTRSKGIEVRASAVPPEKIVVGGRFAPSGFYKRETRKQAPIEVIIVGGL